MKIVLDLLLTALLTYGTYTETGIRTALAVCFILLIQSIIGRHQDLVREWITEATDVLRMLNERKS